MSDENKPNCDDDGCKPEEKCGCSSMSKQTSSGKQVGIGTYIGVLIIILAAVVGANSLKNGKQKECDTESGCCPSTETKVVAQEEAPAASCCPAETPEVAQEEVVAQEEAPAASCCPSDTPVVAQDAPAASCCPAP